ncbi:DUF503 domain-containing protein [Sulfurihydrogenibium subterraneum]|uniref:DUF503 domain-containing protein n=1 Tax=Sulfurihydrogenibium subterraneum TaxID=171121 RepID=UPI000490F7F3|nr:DUF503 domain-containing protein [Sulfurihydrogenibium subterraneum]
MMIGSLVMQIHIHDAGSLKEKRMVIRSIKEKLRSKFNVSVSEVDNQDLWQLATVAVVTVAPDKNQVENILQNVINFVYSNFPELHIDVSKEIF